MWLIAFFVLLGIVAAIVNGSQTSKTNKTPNKSVDDVIYKRKNTTDKLMNPHKLPKTQAFQEYKSYIQDEIEQYQICSTLDKNTCSICGEMDQKVF